MKHTSGTPVKFNNLWKVFTFSNYSLVLFGNICYYRDSKNMQLDLIPGERESAGPVNPCVAGSSPARGDNFKDLEILL